MGLTQLWWTEPSFCFPSILSTLECKFWSSQIFRFTLSYNAMRNLSVCFLNCHSYFVKWYVPPPLSSFHESDSWNLIWMRFQRYVLCSPQASEVPVCGNFCGYSSLFLSEQQGLEPFPTAFTQATVHQENKSKRYFQNQLSMPHTSQQVSPSAMNFALHSFHTPKLF